MGTYEELKSAIQQVIRTNGNNEITGALLQNALLSIVNVVGANATFAGIATPNTNPGTADQNVFYLATEAGTYVNFGGIKINMGEAVILSNKTGVWVKTTSGFATQQKLTELENTITIIQYLKNDDATNNKYWGKVNQQWDGTNVRAYKPFLLKKGFTYNFIKVYGYFCWIQSTSTGESVRLTSNTANSITISYTPTENVYVYVSADNRYEAMVVNDAEYVLASYTEGVVAIRDSLIPKDIVNIYVGKDKEYTKLVSAVAAANKVADGKKEINIHIDEGEYNLFEEFGGDAWLSKVTWRGSGFRLGDKVNLIGKGYVVLRMELPDTATLDQSTYIAGIDLYASNRLENINVYAKNCRYVVHDENDGGNVPLIRVVKNCRFEMLGTQSHLWSYISTYGGGCGGNGQYDFINCIFINHAYYQGFSFHTNNGAKPSYFNVDGCVSIVNSPTGRSFRCGYYGKNQIGETIFHFKNCTGNAKVVKNAETEDSTDHIKMFVNGYVQIEE